MRNLIVLAFRNLARHVKRTIITCIAIAFGIALLIWMDAMLRWADSESKRNLKKYEFGNFIVCTKEYKEDRKNFPADLVMTGTEIKKVTEIAGKAGTAVSLRTGFKSMVSFNRSFGLPYVIMAVDPEMETRVFKIKDTVIKGEYLNRDSQGILISRHCKKELGVELGGYLTVETRTRYGTFQGLTLKVIGIYDSPDPIVNRNQLFITRGLAEEQLQLDGTASEIAFSTPNSENEPALAKVREMLKAEGLDRLTTQTWQELGYDYLALSQTKKGGSSIMIMFIFIIVAVGIVNTMLMAVFERIREIGMIRALGMRDRDVILSFMFEAAGIGLIGSFFGLIGGIALNAYSIFVGLDFSAAFKDIDYGYRTGTVFRCEWNPDMMAAAVLFAVLCSVLVSVLPARKAVKMEITDSIRYI